MSARVFEEQQFAARLQHAPDFCQRAGGIRDAAKDERPHDCLKYPRGEGQTLRIGLGHCGADAARPAARRSEHLPAFVQRKDARTLAVVRKVDAGASADLEHRSARFTDHLPP